MIDREYGNIVYECDGCDETLSTLEDEWGPAKRQFDNNGWRAEKVGDDWTHLCPDCQERK